MHHIKKMRWGIAALVLVPNPASAAQIDNLSSLIDYAKATVNSLIPLLFGIALIAFIWGVIKYIHADGPEKLGEARNYIIFSIIAITIMFSVWGLALMLKNTFFQESPTTLESMENRKGTPSWGAN